MSSIFLSSTGSGQSQGPEHYDLPATSWHGDPRGVAHWKPSGRTPRLWGMAGGVHYFSMSIMGLINQYVFGMGWNSHADQSLALSSSCDSPRPNCKWAVVLRWYPHPSQSTIRRASDSSSLPGSLVAKAGYEKPWSTWEDGNLDYLDSQWGIWRISIHWIRNIHPFLNWHSAVAPLGPPKGCIAMISEYNISTTSAISQLIGTNMVTYPNICNICQLAMNWFIHQLRFTSSYSSYIYIYICIYVYPNFCKPGRAIVTWPVGPGVGGMNSRPRRRRRWVTSMGFL